MSADLRDLMNRVANHVEPVSVAPDTWQRARRARARERVVVPALVTLLVLAGVTVGLRPSLLPAPLDPVDRPVVGGAGAVPDRIHAVPERLDQRRADRWTSPSEPARTVRRAAAAYVTMAGRPVLVSAIDGDHHLVDLPGYDGAFTALHEEVPVAVSPDGRLVAYDWRTPERPATGRWPSGVAVLALDGSGGPTVHRLDGGVGVKVSALSWSPNGRFLVYRVTTFATAAQGGGFSSGDFRLERLDVATGERIVVRRLGRSLAGPPSVSDDGVVALAAGELVTWSERQEPRRSDFALPRTSGSTSAWAADGIRVAVAGSGPGAPIAVVDTLTGSTEELPGTDAQVAKVLAWVSDRHVLLSRHPETWWQVELVLLDTTTGEQVVVGSTEGPAAEMLSVATGLMTAERPTVEFAPPSWVPWHETWRTWLEWAGGLVLLAGLVLMWRRGRRRATASAVPAREESP